MILHAVLLALLCIPLVELVLVLPFVPTAQTVIGASQKAARTVAAKRISDHWKEKAMAAYAGRTFGATLALAGLLLIFFIVAGGLSWGIDLLAPGFLGFALGGPGLLLSLGVASVYAVLRHKLRKPRRDYGALDRVLHRLALGNRAIAEFSFDLDQKQVRRKVKTIVGNRHVFVAGLARAGTTILMRRFHASGAFRSLTYRDMPFVLAPNLWRRLSQQSQRQIAAAERAQGDRITVDADSPESLDEVYWRIFCGPDYIHADRLTPHRPPLEVVARFRAYVTAILAASSRREDRYLSKNNNNILRLKAIRAAFPKALILIPFREPLAHAESLRRQHANFQSQQGEDGFVKAYMGWLAHHEFGADHRPFIFGGDRPGGAPETLNYWLDLWCATYDWLLNNAPADCLFVCYEDLCTDPGVWQGLAARAGIAADSGTEAPFSLRAQEGLQEVDAESRATAAALYERLRERSQQAQ
ncbi:MAG: sulfotransferase [Magnetospiraceae bacterium]